MSGGAATGTGGTSDLTSPAPKRLRVSRACEQCRSRKSKCDGQTPVCSPCASLSQQCTYGSQPKKRGLAPGSVSALEKSVKLLQRCLGLLLVTVSGSEEALLAMVQQYPKALLDGDEGTRLTLAWKEGSVLEALDALQTEGAVLSRPLPQRAPPLDIPAGLSRIDAHFRVHFSSEGSRNINDNFSDSDREAARVVTQRHENEKNRDYGRADDVIGQIEPKSGLSKESESEMSMNYDVHLSQPNIDDRTTYRNRAFSPPSLSIIPTSETTSSPSANYIPRQTPTDTFTRPVYNSRPEDVTSTSSSPAVASHLVQLIEESPQLPKNSRLLLDNYFSYTHIWFPILDKYDVVRLHHTINRHAKQPNLTNQQVTPGKRALLYAVLSQASLQQEMALFQVAETDKAKQALKQQTASGQLYKSSQDLIFTSDEYTIHHVQALLILSLINVSQSQLKTAWYIIGHAGRIAVDVGLKSPGSSSFFKRTWMGYLILESLVSLFLGREPQVTESDWKIPSIPEDGWEEWDQLRGISGTSTQNMASTDDTNVPAHILSVFNQLVRLAGIIRRIAVQRFFKGHSKSLVQESSRSSTPASTPEVENTLQQVQIWLQELPTQCALKPPEHGLSILPHVANLHLLCSWAALCIPEGPANNGGYVQATACATRMRDTATATMLRSFASCQSFGIAPCTFVYLADTTNQIDNPAFNSLRTFKQDFSKVQDLQSSKTLFRRLSSHTDASRFETPRPEPPSHLQKAQPRYSTSSEIQASPRQVSILDQASPSSYPLVVGGSSSNETIQNNPTTLPGFYGLSSSISTIAPQNLDRPSFSMTIREEDLNASNINTQNSSSMTGLLFSLPPDSASPDTDAFDEEMGMLESLPWAQNGIPEFMQNLGYVGGLSPQAVPGQQGIRDQAPEPELGKEGNSPDQVKMGYANRGLNTVLEQWLGDVLGAGNGNSSGNGNGGSER